MQRQASRVAGDHVRARRSVPGRRQRAGRQIDSEHPGVLAAPGELGQVNAVAAAYVEHELGPGQLQRVPYQGREVQLRLGDSVAGRPGSQVAFARILNLAQELLVPGRSLVPWRF